MLRTTLKITLWIIEIAAAPIALLLFAVWIFSRFISENGTKTAKKGWVEINGIKQRFSIRTFSKKLNYLRSTMFSLNMFHEVIENNLFNIFTRFNIPVYIIQRKYDYMLSYQIAKEHLNSIIKQ